MTEDSREGFDILKKLIHFMMTERESKGLIKKLFFLREALKMFDSYR